jgi:hypothetical protein
MPKCVPVVDEFYQRYTFASADEANGLAAQGFTLLRTRRRIHAVMIPRASQHVLGAPAGGRSGNGMPHDHETYSNPAGCMTFDFIRTDLRPVFTRVIQSCLTTTP